MLASAWTSGDKAHQCDLAWRLSASAIARIMAAFDSLDQLTF
jgi:hypothetical protein